MIILSYFINFVNSLTAKNIFFHFTKFSFREGEYKLVEFGFERYNGKQTDLENKDGKVVVNVSECPVFVVEK